MTSIPSGKMFLPQNFGLEGWEPIPLRMEEAKRLGCAPKKGVGLPGWSGRCWLEIGVWRSCEKDKAKRGQKGSLFQSTSLEKWKRRAEEIIRSLFLCLISGIFRRQPSSRPISGQRKNFFWISSLKQGQRISLNKKGRASALPFLILFLSSRVSLSFFD